MTTIHSPTTEHLDTKLDGIATLIRPALADLGFELVLVRLMGGQRRTLQVMIEPADHARSMTVDDCAEVSHIVSTLLDVADPLPGQYALEVTSPGIDRPLVRPADFQRFKGHEARVELAVPLDGRKRLRGRLDGWSEAEGILMTVDGAALAVPLARVKKAKLVLTDALIAAALRAERQLDGGAAAQIKG